MLTRSPIQPSPANASPLNPFPVYHYAPASSSRQSPSSSRLSASLNRTQLSPALSATTVSADPSNSNTKASPLLCPPPPKRYVAVDASTQYSPMDPPTGTVAEVGSEAQTAGPIATNTASHDQPQTGHSTEGQAAQSTQSTQTTAEPSLATATTANASTADSTTLGVAQPVAQQISSPNKRRKSQSQHEDGPSASGSEASGRPPSPAKRAKQEAAPPKVLPQRYELCQVEDVVVLVANLLCELIETNDKLALKTGHLTRFHSRTAPGISVVDYLHRLAKHATLSPPLLLSMVYYIDRLFSAYPDFTINTLTVHRFLITAATVAAKGLSDSFWNNSTYARVGGVRVAELNLLELEFLQRVDWRIVPKPEELVAYYRGLVERCDKYQLEEEEPSDDEADESSDEMDNQEEAMTTTDDMSHTTTTAVQTQTVQSGDAAKQAGPTKV